MKHKVRVVDSGGNVSHRKLTWVRAHERDGAGEFQDGVFFFFPLPQACSRSTTETLTPCPPREVSLADRLAAVPTWPRYYGPHDGRSFQIHGFLPYPQRSQRSTGPLYPTLSRLGAGMGSSNFARSQ